MAGVNCRHGSPEPRGVIYELRASTRQHIFLNLFLMSLSINFPGNILMMSEAGVNEGRACRFLGASSQLWLRPRPQGLCKPGRSVPRAKAEEAQAPWRPCPSCLALLWGNRGQERQTKSPPALWFPDAGGLLFGRIRSQTSDEKEPSICLLFYVLL